MAIKLKYFAWVRERIGRSEDIVEPPESVTTIAELVAWLKTQGAEYEAAFATADTVRAAIDMAHVEASAKIGPGAEVAFFPPVTGG
ncbi:Molybdopterin synthase sulfur carrier subunit [hydrothermal vent metagenome]|uniref:Molybdopterin synthase sulfur carrier subunit n=1 Tax=hydrothermal vent metagenome TaxID=652676 RepID=A0A3B0T5B2_9ZZZZ